MKINEEAAKRAALLRMQEGVSEDITPEVKKQQNEETQTLLGNTQRQRVDYIDDGRWHDVMVDKMPMGIFYADGIHIQARAVTVSEVQHYSTVDNNNIYDITEKMNDVLANCIKITFADGTRGSYRDLFDGDRLYLIFLIRELSFQSNAGVTVKAKCTACKADNEIVMAATEGERRQRTIINYELPEKLKKWYNSKTKTIRIKSKLDNTIIDFRPPTIGIQREFYAHIKRAVQEGTEPNVSFAKVMPFLLKAEPHGKDDMELLETEFATWDIQYYTICNSVIDLMIMGIKGLMKRCDTCGEEVHTKISFPDGASALIAVPIKLDDFIE